MYVSIKKKGGGGGGNGNGCLLKTLKLKLFSYNMKRLGQNKEFLLHLSVKNTCS